MELRQSYFKKEETRSKEFLLGLDQDMAKALDAIGGIRPYTHRTELFGFGGCVRIVAELEANSPPAPPKEKPPAAKPGVKRRKRRAVRTARAPKPATKAK